MSKTLIGDYKNLSRYNEKLQTFYGEWSEQQRLSHLYLPDPRLIQMPVDTTLTIIRKPLKLSTSNRFSTISTTDFAIGHLGYIETIIDIKKYEDFLERYKQIMEKSIDRLKEEKYMCLVVGDF